MLAGEKPSFYTEKNLWSKFIFILLQRKEYVKYAKVFPFSEMFHFKIPAKWYRRVIGSLELICGLAMAIVPKDTVKQVANIILVFLMIMAVYSHYMVNDKFERIAPALVIIYFMDY